MTTLTIEGDYAGSTNQLEIDDGDLLAEIVELMQAANYIYDELNGIIYKNDTPVSFLPADLL